MNVYDKASLFAMSYAFMRRFAFVDVAVPAPGIYRRLIQHFFTWPTPIDDPSDIKRELCALFDRSKKQNYLVRRRALGPAIAQDIVGYLRQRIAGKGSLSRAQLAEALNLYVVAQLDGLERQEILEIHEQLRDFFAPRAGQGDDCEAPRSALLRRIEELFPFIGPDEWEKKLKS